MSANPVYWRMRNGKFISIDDMDVNHLRNVLKMLVNNSNKRLQKKKQFVLNGDMAEQFNYEQECDATEIDLY
jgi:hypothetical protein